MGRLLSAHFARLWKNRVFWALLAILLAFAGWKLFRELSVIANYDFFPQERWGLLLFAHARPLGLALAVLTGLFSGDGYAGGAVRNQLIVGHSRAAVYLSALLTVTAAAFLLCLSYTAVAAAGGWLILGPMEDTSLVPLHLLAVLAMCLSYCALFTLVGMNCAQPAHSALLCLGLTGAMFVLCQFVLSGSILRRTDGDAGAVPLRFLYHLLPMGQGDLLRDISIGLPLGVPPRQLVPYSALFTAVTTATGLLLFRRKDIK